MLSTNSLETDHCKNGCHSELFEYAARVATQIMSIFFISLTADSDPKGFFSLLPAYNLEDQ